MMEEDTGGGWIGDGEGVMDTLSDRRQIYCALNSSNLINNNEEESFFESSQVNHSYFDTHLP